MPSFAGLWILGSHAHIHTVVVWGILRLIETLEGHSGYDFPWSMFRLIPFGAGPTYHYWHHTKNAGNYSSFMTLWDTVLDSNKDFFSAYPSEDP